MAAPTIVARQTPTGLKLKNGHGTLISLQNDPDCNFWEQAVQPPGYDGGDSISQTTMHNDEYETKAPGPLIDITDGSAEVRYDPGVLEETILSQINVEQSITYKHPDGSTEAHWGYLKSFVANQNQSREAPTAQIVIVHTNTDPSDGSEAGPAYSMVAGT